MEGASAVEFEPMERFDRELRHAFARQPAPLGLKARILAHRRRPESRGHGVLCGQRLAATLALAAVLGGAALWHQREERRREGEAARQQVLTALRITSHALNQMNRQLAAHRRISQE